MKLTDFLFPKQCVNCKKDGSYVCTPCIKRLSRIKQVCPECEKSAVDGITHVKCKRKSGLDGLVSLWPYEGVIRRAILTLKFKFAKEVLADLDNYVWGELEKYTIALPKEATLVPIPMYWYKENLRGFNQVAEIGKMITQWIGWEFNSNMLIRKAMRQPQSSLTGEERVENVKGVFEVTKNYQLQIFNNQSLVLFDDVYTTGSTMKEACRTLKRNGVREVWGLTIARRV